MSECTGSRITLLASAIVMAMSLLAGCGDGGGGNSTADGGAQGDAGAAPVSPGADKDADGGSPVGGALAITATPDSQVMAGALYALQPQVSHAQGEVSYAIDNPPEWAEFDTATGRLVGVPAARHAGSTVRDIVISVTDGQRRASLEPFAITVTLRPGQIVLPAMPPVVDDMPGRVTLSWQVPTLTEQDALLADLDGYRIHYGADAQAMVHAIELPGSGTNQVVIDDLDTGRHYFAVRAVRAGGEISALSNIVSREVK